MTEFHTDGVEQNRQEVRPQQTQETAGLELPKTQQELEKLLQQTADKRVTQAVETVKAKLEQEWTSRLEVEKQEAARLAKMSESERFAALQQKREQELAQREQLLLRRELRSQAVEQLTMRGLPADLACALDYSDAESCTNSMAKVENAFRRAVQEGVNQRFNQVAGTPGGSSALPADDAFTKAFRR